MNTTLPKPYIVVSCPTRHEIQNSIFCLQPAFVAPTITQRGVFPHYASAFRVDMHPVETLSLGDHKFNRPASLGEIALFVRKYPNFLKEFGGLEGFDSYLEKYGRARKSTRTIPCMYLDDSGKIVVNLRRYDLRVKTQPFTLIVTSEYAMKVRQAPTK
jgi:hypothetical protein